MTSFPSLAVAQEAQPRRKDTRLPQPKQARLTTYANPKRELKPGQTFTYNVKVHLDDGWRIFPFSPEQPVDGGPVFTKFDLFDTGGFEVVSGWHTSKPATAKHLPAFPDRRTVEFYEDEVTWSIRLKVPQTMNAGERTLKCQASYELVSDKAVTFPGRWALPEVRVKVNR
jgi:thiol:disulfide interchange protein DsbD